MAKCRRLDNVPLAGSALSGTASMAKLSDFNTRKRGENCVRKRRQALDNVSESNPIGWHRWFTSYDSLERVFSAPLPLLRTVDSTVFKMADRAGCFCFFLPFTIPSPPLFYGTSHLNFTDRHGAQSKTANAPSQIFPKPIRAPSLLGEGGSSVWRRWAVQP